MSEKQLTINQSMLSRGIQYACAKQVNRIGVVTTMITGTLASLVSRIVHRRELPMSYDQKNSGLNTAAAATGQNKNQLWHPTETTIFLVSVWGGYFAGAIMSVAALFVSRSAAATIPLVLVVIVVGYSGIRQRQKHL